jgi:hypothetical protein
LREHGDRPSYPTSFFSILFQHPAKDNSPFAGGIATAGLFW